MSRFCTQCGTANDSDAGFCENCGTSLTKAAPTSQVNSSPEIQNRNAVYSSTNRKPLLIGAIAIGVVVIVGGALAFFLSDETPSNDVFSKAISTYYQQHQDETDKLVCMTDNLFAPASVNVNHFDNNTHGLMEALVAAGLYAHAAQVNNGGFINPYLDQYKKTDLGSQTITNNKLCIAKGINITNVRFDRVLESPSGKHVLVHYQTALKEPAAWLSKPVTDQFSRFLQLNQERVISMGLVDRKWTVTLTNVPFANAKFGAVSLHNESAGPSLLDKIRNLFGPSNPVLGTWQVSSMAGIGMNEGIPSPNFIFEEDQATTSSGKFKVRYEINGSQVNVCRIGNGDCLVLQVVDSDHLDMGGNQGITLTRLKN